MTAGDVTAVILAGSRPGGDPFAASLGATHKALIPVAGTAMLARVVAALRAAGIRRILVSCDAGPVADLARDLGTEPIAPAAGPSGSVLAALDLAGTPLLVTTADHALLQAAWVEQLIDGADIDSDVAIMLAECRLIEGALPGSRRTYLRFADGHWSGCNLFLLRTQAARAAVIEWTRVEADRKRPWRIVARLGAGLLLRYLTGGLTLAGALDRLGGRIGCRVALVPAADGLAAVDVDKIADLQDVERLLAGR
jgi:GTP:adenosylcobinamide-phosphate guanylyltransferase